MYDPNPSGSGSGGSQNPDITHDDGFCPKNWTEEVVVHRPTKLLLLWEASILFNQHSTAYNHYRSQIAQAEYFVDTDPGEGNGTAFQAKDGAFDSEVESILPKDLNVTGLSVGPHSVCDTRIITTPGARSSTRPFMCTMPIQTSITVVVEDRVARADLL